MQYPQDGLKILLFPNSHLQYPYQTNVKALHFSLEMSSWDILKNIIFDLIHLCVTLLSMLNHHVYSFFLLLNIVKSFVVNY
jgi:hypothetical protein